MSAIVCRACRSESARQRAAPSGVRWVMLCMQDVRASLVSVTEELVRRVLREPGRGSPVSDAV